MGWFLKHSQNGCFPSKGAIKKAEIRIPRVAQGLRIMLEIWSRVGRDLVRGAGGGEAGEARGHISEGLALKRSIQPHLRLIAPSPIPSLAP